MTPDELHAIEARNGRLYDLWDTCAKKGLGWHTKYEEVRDLMRHLNDQFPGMDVALLLGEVRFLQERVVELTAGRGQGQDRGRYGGHPPRKPEQEVPSNGGLSRRRSKMVRLDGPDDWGKTTPS